MSNVKNNDLNKLLDSPKFEQKFISLFNQGFEEIVLPNIKDLGNRLDKVENRLDNVEKNLKL